MDSRKTLKKSKGWGRVNIRISTGDVTPRKAEILRNSEQLLNLSKRGKKRL